MQLEDIQTGEVLQGKGEPVVVSVDAKVKEALEKLVAARRTAVAVVSTGSEDDCVAVLGLFELLDFVVTFIHKEGMGRTEEEINLMIRDRLNDTVGTLLEQRNEKPPVRVNLQDSLEKVSEKSGLLLSSIWRSGGRGCGGSNSEWLFTSFQTKTPPCCSCSLLHPRRFSLRCRGEHSGLSL